MSNLGEEHGYEEDDEFSENTPEINDSIKSKISKSITEEDVVIFLLAKTILIKVIQTVIYSIDAYERDILSDGNENKKIQSNTNGIIVIICP